MDRKKPAKEFYAKHRGSRDVTLFVLVCILAVFGLVMLYSTSAYNGYVKFGDAGYYFKKQLFATFHEQMPDAKFVIMSGLLLPGRNEYTVLTQMINDELEKLCNEMDYLYFVDAEAMTFDGSTYAAALFVTDGIHLNHDGQLLWMESYIQPMIEDLIEEYSLEHLRKEG